MDKSLRIAGCLLLLLMPWGIAAGADPTPNTPLADEIARQDAALSDAFNGHDLTALMALFDDSLEFFHDLGGLQHYADVEAGFKSLFAKNDGIRRDLVPGTFEVYPIHDYGAIEVGEHRFCHSERGEQVCGTFKFLHVWKKEGAGWKITRVASYGHEGPRN